jgi:hypothetical protein
VFERAKLFKNTNSNFSATLIKSLDLDWQRAQTSALPLWSQVVEPKHEFSLSSGDNVILHPEIHISS